MRPLIFSVVLAVLASAASAQSPTFRQSDGMPLSRVVIDDLPAMLDSLRLDVAVPNEPVFDARVERLPSGEIAMVVPIHPDVLSGGDVMVSLFDRDDPLGDPLPFRILGVPEAPGTMRRITQTVERGHAAMARAYGMPAERLNGPIESLPVQLWSTAATREVFRDDAPTALPAVLAGTGAVNGQTVDPAISDALAALFDLESEIDAYVARMEAIGAPPDPVTTTPVGEFVPRGANGGPDPSPLVWRTLYDRVDITTAANLSHFMRLAEENRQTANSLLLKWASTANDHAGLVPHPVVQAGTIVVSAGLFAVVEDALIQSLLLPSMLTDGRADFSTSVFLEDYTEPGTWSEYLVGAQSKEWPIGTSVSGLFAEALSGSIGFARVGGPASAPFGGGGPEVTAAVYDGYLEMQVTNSTKQAMVNAGSARGFTVGPFAWEGIDLVSTNWSTTRAVAVRGTERLAVIESSRLYRPVEVGRGALRIEPKPGLFPPSVNTGRAAVVHIAETEAISVTLSPASRTVDPGSELWVQATVQKANDTRLEWAFDGPSYGVVIQPEDEGAMLFFPEGNPIQSVRVKATSLARTGLRDPGMGPEPREAVGVYATREEEEVELPLVGSCAYDIALTSERLSLQASASNQSADGLVGQTHGGRAEDGTLLWVEVMSSPFQDGEIDYSGISPSVSAWFQEPGDDRMLRSIPPSEHGLTEGIPLGATGSFEAWVTLYFPLELSGREDDINAYSTDPEDESLYEPPFLPGTITILRNDAEVIEGVIEADMTFLDTQGLEDLANSMPQELIARDQENKTRTAREQMEQIQPMFFDAPVLRVPFRGVTAPQANLGPVFCLFPLLEAGELSDELTGQLESVVRMMQGQ